LLKYYRNIYPKNLPPNLNVSYGETTFTVLVTDAVPPGSVIV
jgi:hypothetical protein